MTNSSIKNTKNKCDPQEIALKHFFLGPQAENAPWFFCLIGEVLNRWAKWRKSLYPDDGYAISELDQTLSAFVERRQNFEVSVNELLDRFEQEVPKFSPRYVGHMFSEVSLPALLGHLVALVHNPNNISGESSRVGTQIENEAIQFLLEMVGYSTSDSSGHFTSGGTLANFEALFRAQSRLSLWLASRAALKANGLVVDFDPWSSAHQGWREYDNSILQIKSANLDLQEILKWNFGVGNSREITVGIEALNLGSRYLGPVVFVPANMHYSWQKGCKMFGLGSEALWPIDLDANGRLSIEHLRELIDLAAINGRPILMVVSVAGSTELGSVDPIDRVQDLLDHLRNEKGIHIWHHVDAAYGGFFRTIDFESSRELSADVIGALLAMSRADSLTIDPHKLGYIPYASGAFLVRNRRDYCFSAYSNAPYIDFDDRFDRGPFTLEGSRSAAGAVATWLAAKTMGFGPKGYGLLLERTVRIAKHLIELLKNDEFSIQIAPGCDTNVICFICANQNEPLSESNRRTLKLYENFSPRKNNSFIVSKTTLYWESHGTYLDEWTRQWSALRDRDELVLIRMTMMNPFFGSTETDVNYGKLFVRELKRNLC